MPKIKQNQTPNSNYRLVRELFVLFKRKKKKKKGHFNRKLKQKTNMVSLNKEKVKVLSKDRLVTYTQL